MNMQEVVSLQGALITLFRRGTEGTIPRLTDMLSAEWQSVDVHDVRHAVFALERAGLILRESRNGIWWFKTSTVRLEDHIFDVLRTAGPMTLSALCVEFKSMPIQAMVWHLATLVQEGRVRKIAGSPSTYEVAP